MTSVDNATGVFFIAISTNWNHTVVLIALKISVNTQKLAVIVIFIK